MVNQARDLKIEIPVDESLAGVQEIEYALAYSPFDAAPLLLKKKGDGVSHTSTLITVTLTKEDVADLDGEFYQEVRITDADGDQVSVDLEEKYLTINATLLRG